MFIYIAQYHKCYICLSGLHSLYRISVWQYDTLCPYVSHHTRKNFQRKTHSLKGKWEKPQGEQQRRDPSPRTDRRAIDAVCIYKCKPSQADSGGGSMHLKVVWNPPKNREKKKKKKKKPTPSCPTSGELFETSPGCDRLFSSTFEASRSSSQTSLLSSCLLDV